MTSRTPELSEAPERAIGRAFGASAAAADSPRTTLAEFHAWFAARKAAGTFQVERIPFDQLNGWSFDERTGNLGHHSGKFFTVEGLSVRTDHGPITSWTQPIVNQPEVGILGIVVKEFDGVLHCLMQAKMEPGNANVLQLSPTVQATRSNYTRVHQGAAIPYLDYFTQAKRGKVLVDVLQSEQGAWFYRKQNRNMVVEVTGEVEDHEDFVWLTLGQVQQLLTIDDLVNMDARTVLSCIPYAVHGAGDPDDDEFTTALRRSVEPDSAPLHGTGDILSWITEARSLFDLRAERIPLHDVRGWHRTAEDISHDEGKHFSVMAVSVQASNREVVGWTQPLLAPHGTGVVCFLTKKIDGVLHVLVHARVEAGYLDIVELAPTVQCTPENYQHLDVGDHPPYLNHVLTAPPEQIRFDAVQSEEGGRFYHAQNRYLIIEVGDEFPVQAPTDYRWLTVHQITGLLRHSHYLNVQARTLVACLHGLW